MAYQSDGQYARYTLKNCDKMLLQILIRELKCSPPPNTDLREYLYEEYYAKPSRQDGAIESSWAMFEGENAIHLVEIDRNLKHMFMKNDPLFRPCCRREAQIAIDMVKRQRYLANSRLRDADHMLTRAENAYRGAEHEFLECDKEYNRILDLLHIAQHKIKLVLCERIPETRDDETCPICMDECSQASTVILNCNHKTCDACIYQYFNKLKRNAKPICSLCRTPITKMVFGNDNSRQRMTNEFIA